MKKKCQIDSIETMSVGKAPLPLLTVEQCFRIFARRYMSPRIKKRIKRLVTWLLPGLNKPKQPSVTPVSSHRHEAPKVFVLTPPAQSVSQGAATDSVSQVRVSPTETPLQAGDLVRVRDRKTIESTLNQSHQYKGCAFMGDMWQYCGTVQRVMKRVQRFVDERDARVYKATGIVLLENMICQGTADYGPCDRSCFYFWREEWLEKIELTQTNMDGGR
jgi:hypothetical protein